MLTLFLHHGRSYYIKTGDTLVLSSRREICRILRNVYGGGELINCGGVLRWRPFLSYDIGGEN